MTYRHSLLSFALLLTICAESLAANIGGQVDISADNSDYIKIDIDTTQLSGDRELRDVTVDVSFFNGANEFLGRNTFPYTDLGLAVLPSGTIVRRFFKHPFDSAKYVRDFRINYVVASIAMRPKGGGNLLIHGPLPLPSGFVEQASFVGQCAGLPAGSSCVGYSDGYVLAVDDGIVGFREYRLESGQTVEVGIGGRGEYHHILTTDLFRRIQK